MSSFSATITVERVEDEVTFTATAFNGGKVIVRQNEMDGAYEQFLLLVSTLVDAAKEAGVVLV